MGALIFFEILFSLVFGFIFALILFLTSESRSVSGFMIYFAVLFLLIWAGGIWIRPAGPYLWGVPVFSFMIVGFVVTLFLLIAAPGRRTRTFSREETMEKVRKDAERRDYILPILMGVIVAILVTIIILGYVMARI